MASRWRTITDSVRWWFGFCALVWLVVMFVILGAYWFAEKSTIPWTVLAYALVTVLTSLVASILYAVDKRRSMKDRPRISERTLHAWSLVGGWPGAYLAQQKFRHKTAKTRFRMTYWLIVLVHVSLIALIVYHWWFTQPTPPAA